ncbi:hypothetical protein A0H81_10555 [Grifola frondosa]|uniref:Uncharacterized protein n=1 Tax=Grifola frondosa TaxID=5627 RepID=A0A1C7LXW8_GRIFR|nr:hypothetical protein A0H81_10555 [Grifola frondosa]
MADINTETGPQCPKSASTCPPTSTTQIELSMRGCTVRLQPYHNEPSMTTPHPDKIKATILPGMPETQCPPFAVFNYAIRNILQPTFLVAQSHDLLTLLGHVELIRRDRYLKRGRTLDEAERAKLARLTSAKLANAHRMIFRQLVNALSMLDIRYLWQSPQSYEIPARLAMYFPSLFQEEEEESEEEGAGAEAREKYVFHCEMTEAETEENRKVGLTCAQFVSEAAKHEEDPASFCEENGHEHDATFDEVFPPPDHDGIVSASDREHKSALARTVQHHVPTASHPDSPGQKSERALTPLVIDGWSFIYQLICSADIPWVYGGEYDKFAALVTRVVRAWVRVGLALYFVFDATTFISPFSVSPSLTTELTQLIPQARTPRSNSLPSPPASPKPPSSAASSSSAPPRRPRRPAVPARNRHAPPHSYVVCVAVLRALAESDQFRGALEVHFADEEGDPYAVALAGRLRACVAGCDSDFAVFNADGYRGYVPLDEMVWSAASAAEDDAEGSVYSGSADTEFDVDDGGFRTVRPKARKRAAAASRLGRGLLPPDDVAPTDLALSYTVYTRDALAAHLALPVSLLPLLGALKKRARRQVGSVMELIDVAVGALLLRTTDADERAAVVERIVEATLQYAIPRGAEGEESARRARARGNMGSGRHRGTSVSSHDAEGDVRARVSELYIAAYRRGELNPRVLDPVSTGRAGRGSSSKTG